MIINFDFNEDAYVQKWTRVPELYPYERIIINRFFDGKGTVLVGGCGTGRESVPIARKGHDVFALDISKKMIKAAKDLHANDTNISFSVGDVTHIFVDDNSFNYYLLLNNTINLVRDVDDAIAEGFRVLKDDGIFCLTMHNPYSLFCLKNWWRVKGLYLHKPDAVAKKLKSVGFTYIYIHHPH